MADGPKAFETPETGGSQERSDRRPASMSRRHFLNVAVALAGAGTAVAATAAAGSALSGPPAPPAATTRQRNPQGRRRIKLAVDADEAAGGGMP
ncbi:MAG: hypothetical protein ACP5P1_14985 [Acidimicrobiales bacterium]